MKKQRWRFTTGKQYKCRQCGYKLDKRYVDKDRIYQYCSAYCEMRSVGMSWSDFA